MKKISIIVILSIIFSLCVVPYGLVYAEPESDSDSGTVTETEQPTDSSSGEAINVDPSNSEEASGNDTQESNNPDSPSQEYQSSSNPSGTSETAGSTGYKSRKTNNNPTQPDTKKSDNANLADLGITPNDFKGFKPSTLTYSVTVPNDTERINVYAKVQDSKAQITSGTGNHNLDVGTNDIEVIVTAENGDTKTYTINITREEAKEEQTTTTGTETKKSDLVKLEIKGYSLNPVFSADIYEYKLDVKNDVTDLEVFTEGLNDKVNIEVVGNTDLKERREYYYCFSKKF